MAHTDIEILQPSNKENGFINTQEPLQEKVTRSCASDPWDPLLAHISPTKYASNTLTLPHNQIFWDILYKLNTPGTRVQLPKQIFSINAQKNPQLVSYSLAQWSTGILQQLQTLETIKWETKNIAWCKINLNPLKNARYNFIIFVFLIFSVVTCCHSFVLSWHELINQCFKKP